MMKDPISFADFQKLDLRIGKVVKAEKMADSANLSKLLEGTIVR